MTQQMLYISGTCGAHDARRHASTSLPGGQCNAPSQSAASVTLVTADAMTASGVHCAGLSCFWPCHTAMRDLALLTE